MKLLVLFLLVNLIHLNASGQSGVINGNVSANNTPIAFATVKLLQTEYVILTDSLGNFQFENILAGSYKIKVTHSGYRDFEKLISINKEKKSSLNVILQLNDTLTEVVVTGVSRTTLIRENPIAIVSVSAAQIQQTSAPNIMDVLVKHAPGVSVVKTGPNISKPFIRGLGYNRVLTLYNGIRQEGQQWGDEHGIEVDAYNIDRAEVIKGPASLMYGSDALAGVVSMFSYIPRSTDGELHGNFTSEYQSNNNLLGNGLRLDYNHKSIFLSLAGSYRLAKNYRNDIDGRVYNTGFHEKTLSLISGLIKTNGFSHFGLNLYDNKQGIPDGSRDSISRKFTKQIFEGENDIIKTRPIVDQKELNSYALSPLHQHIQHYRIYTHNYYKLGSGDIDLNIAVQQNLRKEYNHPTVPEQPGMFVKLNTLNYSVRYNLPSLKNIEPSIGFNGMLQHNKNMDATDFPIPDYNLIDGGAFVYAKWKQQRWTLGGGIRYDLRQVKWKDFYIQHNPETGFDQHSFTGEAPDAVLQFPAYTKRFEGFSASMGITYQATDKISLKANIGRAYRAPNITEIASNGLDPGAHIIYLGNRNFDPEFSLQEDIGVSARYNDFSADISIFNNNIQNYIYQNLEVDANGDPLIDAQGNRTYKYQQAKAQLYGAEFWFSIHPDKLNGLQFNNSLALVYGFNQYPDFVGTGINGAYLPLMPPARLLSSLSKKTILNSGKIASITPMIEIETAFKQTRYFGYNSSETETPAYTLVNCGIQAEIKYGVQKIFSIQLQAANLLDKSYQSHLNRLKYFEYYNQSPNSMLGMYDMGRSINVKAILPF